MRTFEAAALLALLLASVSCRRSHGGASGPPSATQRLVAVARATVKPIATRLVVSSELRPSQEADVYAKLSGYLADLRVDNGTRVRQGELMATLEIPELVLLIEEDGAAVRRANDLAAAREHELSRLEEQFEEAHLLYTRLREASEARPGLIAQREVDEARFKELAAEAQVETGQADVLASQNQLAETRARQRHDRELREYFRILAPFSGVVTQRYAIKGMLMQAGTNSSTQTLPLVHLAQDDALRLAIPVTETYLRFIRIGDAVEVRVPSLAKTFWGKVVRFSVEATAGIRTMRAEVIVPNPGHVLIPGSYAEATLKLESRSGALVVPLGAVTQTGASATVFVVGAGGRLQQRPIALGVQTPSEAQVLNGLEDGDRVVVSDRGGLRAGEQVTPLAAHIPTLPVEIK